MAATYEPIATTTLSNGTTQSVTFSSISGSYTDLVLVCSASNATSARNLLLRLNSDTGTNYSNTRIFGDGSAAYSDRDTSTTYMYIGINGNSTTDFTTHIINLQNYSNSTTYKTAIARSSYATAYVDSYVGLWRNTSAITSIEITTGAVNWRSGSTFTLYGITAA